MLRFKQCFAENKYSGSQRRFIRLDEMTYKSESAATDIIFLLCHTLPTFRPSCLRVPNLDIKMSQTRTPPTETLMETLTHPFLRRLPHSHVLAGCFSFRASWPRSGFTATNRKWPRWCTLQIHYKLQLCIHTHTHTRIYMHKPSMLLTRTCSHQRGSGVFSFHLTHAILASRSASQTKTMPHTHAQGQTYTFSHATLPFLCVFSLTPTSTSLFFTLTSINPCRPGTHTDKVEITIAAAPGTDAHFVWSLLLAENHKVALADPG